MISYLDPLNLFGLSNEFLIRVLSRIQTNFCGCSFKLFHENCRELEGAGWPAHKLAILVFS